MEKIKIHFLNTIWSDAIILEKDNHYAFIDSATDFYYPMIKKHLDDNQIKTIDFIILTHFHSDHYGNIASLIKDYNVKNIYMKKYYGIEGSTGSGAESNDDYIKNEIHNYEIIINTANQHNTKIIFIDDCNIECYKIDFQNITIELYSVLNDLYKIYTDEKNIKYYNKRIFNENHNSIGIFFKVNCYNIFMGGDLICMPNEISSLNNKAINIIKKIYKTHNINHIDLYKTCHHGHYENNPFELCDLIKAKYAIITNTSKWTDNYSTIKDLKKANPNVKILQTDYQKYIFEIEENITFEKIKEDSLFITLKKE